MLLRTRIAPVVMAQTGAEMDHFAGVEESLEWLGIESDRVLLRQPIPNLTKGMRLAVVSNTEASLSRTLIRHAAAAGGSSVMLMDGLVEWRNTFINPCGGDRFLRPAPVDVITCAGEIDRQVLSVLGNHAVATGLPRFDGLRSVVIEGRPRRHNPPSRLMIATARRPAFGDAERKKLVDTLCVLRDAANAQRIEIVWRVTDGLDEELGVLTDKRPLMDALSNVDGLLTTVSTVMVEGMMLGVPTAVLHPYGTPLWQPSVWRYVGRSGSAECEERMWDVPGLMSQQRSALQATAESASRRAVLIEDARELFERVLSPTASELMLQKAMLADLYAGPCASEAVAAVIADQLVCPTRSGHAAAFVREPVIHLAGEASAGVGVEASGSIPLAAGLALAPRTRLLPAAKVGRAVAACRPRVLLVAGCDDPSGNEATRWAAELIDRSANVPCEYEFILLVVCSSGDAWRSAGQRWPVGQRTSVCVLDPYWQNIEALDVLMRAIELHRPRVVMPMNRDLLHAAALQVRARAGLVGESVDVIGVVSDSDPAWGTLGQTYGEWDAAVTFEMDGASNGTLITGQGGQRKGRIPSSEHLRVGVVVDGLAPAMSDVQGSSAWRSAKPLHHGTRNSTESGTTWNRDTLDGVEVGNYCDSNQLARLLQLIDEARSQRMARSPTALGLRLVEGGHRHLRWSPDTDESRAWTEERLREAGFKCVAAGEPRASSDCVVLESSGGEAVLRQGIAYERRGFAVVYAPTLVPPDSEAAERPDVRDCSSLVVAALERATQLGAKRIVLYGTGSHLLRYAGVVDMGFPIVGIMDDAPPKWGRMFQGFRKVIRGLLGKGPGDGR